MRKEVKLLILSVFINLIFTGYAYSIESQGIGNGKTLSINLMNPTLDRDYVYANGLDQVPVSVEVYYDKYPGKFYSDQYFKNIKFSFDNSKDFPVTDLYCTANPYLNIEGTHWRKLFDSIGISNKNFAIEYNKQGWYSSTNATLCITDKVNPFKGIIRYKSSNLNKQIKAEKHCKNMGDTNCSITKTFYLQAKDLKVNVDGTLSAFTSLDDGSEKLDSGNNNANLEIQRPPNNREFSISSTRSLSSKATLDFEVIDNETRDKLPILAIVSTQDFKNIKFTDYDSHVAYSVTNMYFALGSNVYGDQISTIFERDNNSFLTSSLGFISTGIVNNDRHWFSRKGECYKWDNYYSPRGRYFEESPFYKGCFVVPMRSKSGQGTITSLLSISIVNGYFPGRTLSTIKKDEGKNGTLSLFYYTIGKYLKEKFKENNFDPFGGVQQITYDQAQDICRADKDDHNTINVAFTNYALDKNNIPEGQKSEAMVCWAKNSPVGLSLRILFFDKYGNFFNKPFKVDSENGVYIQTK